MSESDALLGLAHRLGYAVGALRGLVSAVQSGQRAWIDEELKFARAFLAKEAAHTREA